MKTFAVTVFVILFALPAMAGVETEYDQQVDFSAYKTYAWQEGKDAARADVQATIAAAVEHELAAKALTPVESDPDFYVATYVLVDVHSLEELSKPNQWEYWTGVRSVDAYQVGAGTLVIDLIDPETGGVVWRALSSGTVSGPVKKLKKRLPGTVGKIFSGYPPGTR